MINGTREHRLVPALVFFLVLSACSMAGKYTQPDMNLPASYRGADVPDSGKVDIAFTGAIPYRSFFADSSLTVLIDSAVENNLDLRVAVRNIEYASLALKQVRLGNFPELSLQAAGSTATTSDYGRNPLPPGTESTEEYTASLLLSWEADIWGKIRNSRKAALSEYLRTVEAKKAVQTRLVADVAQGYHNLLLLDAQLGISNRNLALADTTLAMMRLQYEAGLVTSLAVEQQEALRLGLLSGIARIEQ
ncbi:MAG: TolC family protein, partial [Chlorobiales bacterium]|nr:TolC family protein [Chlorobiales bacterium]